MNDMIKMVVVLTVLSMFSGGVLAFIKDTTALDIENQKLKFVQGPAIKIILEGATNELVKERFKLKDGEAEHSIFVGVFDGNPNAVVIESFATGYGGDVGFMVGIDTATDKIIGVGVTTHSETPGLGARAKTDPVFSAQFKGMTSTDTHKVSKAGGKVNAIGGATITSSAVCAAATDVGDIYERLKPQILEKLKEFKK
ncbi:RnfABCDGE type electron transport complex subunit G [Desulfobacterales bacterium HSG16]|nr:RnfABCDGE type electron transport complex subunit G [Desulfobacterales bacterium HSG16]